MQDLRTSPSPARRRLFAGLVAVCLAIAVVAIVSAGGGSGEPVPPTARQLLPAAQADGRSVVLFRTVGSERAAGQIALTPRDRLGERTPAPLRCDRVHFAGGRGLCIARGRGFAQGYRASIFGPDLRARDAVGVGGTPSRARVSPDGRLGAVTQFVTGHSYAERGAFSTETTLIDLTSGSKIANLEEFTASRGERIVTAVDVNYWGVTFERDSDRFLATLATGGRTYLVRGSVRARRMRVVHENAECPALSPDGTRVAFKKRVGSGPKPWRLTVLDLATMRETPLAESRAVDDQAEWLDDRTVLYGLDKQVWAVRADGQGQPRRLLARADSPAVVR